MEKPIKDQISLACELRVHHKPDARQQAITALETARRNRKGKRFVLVQVDAKTWIEREVKYDPENNTDELLNFI